MFGIGIGFNKVLISVYCIMYMNVSVAGVTVKRVYLTIQSVESRV